MAFKLYRYHRVAYWARWGNGAGEKTTCISTIIGVLRPRKGDNRLFGERYDGLGPIAYFAFGIGLVPPGPSLVSSLAHRFGKIWSLARNEADVSDKHHGASKRSVELFPQMAAKRHAPTGRHALGRGEQK